MELRLCSICLDPPVDPVQLPCDHTFCRECVRAFVAHTATETLTTRQGVPIRCPNCRNRHLLAPSQLAPPLSGPSSGLSAENSPRRSDWVAAWRDLRASGWKLVTGDRLSDWLYVTPEGMRLRKRERIEGFHYFRTKEEVLQLLAGCGGDTNFLSSATSAYGDGVVQHEDAAAAEEAEGTEELNGAKAEVSFEDVMRSLCMTLLLMS